MHMIVCMMFINSNIWSQRKKYRKILIDTFPSAGEESAKWREALMHRISKLISNQELSLNTQINTKTKQWQKIT